MSYLLEEMPSILVSKSSSVPFPSYQRAYSLWDAVQQFFGTDDKSTDIAVMKQLALVGRYLPNMADTESNTGVQTSNLHIVDLWGIVSRHLHFKFGVECIIDDYLSAQQAQVVVHNNCVFFV